MKLLDKPCVSVIVPVYNVEKHLDLCLESVSRQTLDNIEILVIDDGSTDNSGEIAEKHASKNKKMRVIHKANEGYGKTMNLGLNIARGEFIGILESDDWCSPIMFERLYKLGKVHDVEVIKSDYYIWNSEKDQAYFQTIAKKTEYNQVINIKENYRLLLMTPSIWSAIYKLSFLCKNKINFLETPGASYQDTSFAHKVYCMAKRVYLINEAYIYYRSDNSESSVNNQNKIFSVCDELEESKKFFTENNADLLPLLERVRYGVYMWNYKRLNDEGKKNFLPKMREDFLKIKREGNFDRKLYTKREIANFLRVLSSDISFFGEHIVVE